MAGCEVETGGNLLFVLRSYQFSFVVPGTFAVGHTRTLRTEGGDSIVVHWQAADTLIFAGEKCPAVTELLPDGRREFRGVTFFNLGHIDDLWNDGPPPAPTREP